MRLEYGLSDDAMGRAEAEKLVVDLKRKLLKKMSDDELALLSSEYSKRRKRSAAKTLQSRPYSSHY